MVELPKNYNEIKECPDIETDCSKVVEHLADADFIIAIDTCTLSKYYQYQSDKLEKVIEYFKKKYDGLTVIVFTETILSEFFKFTGNTVSKKFKKLLKKLNQEFTVVLLKEEWLSEWRMSMVEDDISIINQNFIDILNEHRAQLTTIDKYLDTEDNPFKNYIYDNKSAEQDCEFVSNLIRYIKSKKSNKDSLAEQLFMLIVTFVMDLYANDNSEIHSFQFITDDRHAAGRIKDIQKHSELFVDVFRLLTLPHMVKDMYELRIFDSDTELKDFMKFMSINDPFKVASLRNGSLEVIEFSISIDSFIEKIKNDTKFLIVY